MYENFKLIRRYQSQRRTGFRATIIFCRWGPISERRNGGETLGQVRHFHREFMNALCLPRSQRGTSLSSCSLSSTEKKKKNYYLGKSITNNILVDRLSPFSFSLSLFTILLRTRAPKGCTLSKRGKLFPISKENLANRPPKRTGIPEIPQSTTRYLTQETSNLKTDAPTIRHTAETVKGAARFSQVAFQKFEPIPMFRDRLPALNIVTSPLVTPKNLFHEARFSHLKISGQKYYVTNLQIFSHPSSYLPHRPPR